MPPSVGGHDRGVRGRLCRECNCVNAADHAAPAWHVLALVTNGTDMKKESSVVMLCKVCIMEII